MGFQMREPIFTSGGGSPPLHCFDNSVRAAIRRPQSEERKV
jgi:hypothetical protein